jgi:hypothetical protein
MDEGLGCCRFLLLWACCWRSACWALISRSSWDSSVSRLCGAPDEIVSKRFVVLPKLVTRLVWKTQRHVVLVGSSRRTETRNAALTTLLSTSETADGISYDPGAAKGWSVSFGASNRSFLELNGAFFLLGTDRGCWVLPEGG